jgi:hypothetical protein
MENVWEVLEAVSQIVLPRTTRLSVRGCGRPYQALVDYVAITSLLVGQNLTRVAIT